MTPRPWSETVGMGCDACATEHGRIKVSQSDRTPEENVGFVMAMLTTYMMTCVLYVI